MMCRPARSCGRDCLLLAGASERHPCISSCFASRRATRAIAASRRRCSALQSRRRSIVYTLNRDKKRSLLPRGEDTFGPALRAFFAPNFLNKGAGMQTVRSLVHFLNAVSTPSPRQVRRSLGRIARAGALVGCVGVAVELAALLVRSST